MPKTLINKVAQFENCKSFSLMKLVPGENGHVDKKPMSLTTGKLMAWKKHPEQLVTLDTATQALNAVKSKGQTNYRVGILLNSGMLSGNDIICVDIDNVPELVKNAQAGEYLHGKPSQLSNVQEKVIAALMQNGAYTEISQSGKGLHLLFVGHKQLKGRTRNDKFEYYSDSRWICLTGNQINPKYNGTLPIYADIAIKELEQVMFPDVKTTQKTPAKAVNVNNAAFKDNDIDKLLAKIKKSKENEKFFRLYNGGQVSGDTSADDQSFALMLAFWTNNNPAEMDAIFRQSERMRPKWDEKHSVDGKTYGQMTIDFALSHASAEGYKAKKPVNKTKDRQEPQTMVALRRILGKAGNALRDEIYTSSKQQFLALPAAAVVDVLMKHVKFANIVDEKVDKETADNNKGTLLCFYNYDTHLYEELSTNDYKTFFSLLDAVDSRLTKRSTRQDILETVRARSYKLPNKIRTNAHNRNIFAVKNGVVDLSKPVNKRFRPFNSKTDVFTQKVDTPYNRKITDHYIINGWSANKMIAEDADNDPLKQAQLCQVALKAIQGDYWDSKAVFLISKKTSTGKTTFLRFLINIIGEGNTANVQITDFGDPRKFHDVSTNTTLVYGDDYKVGEKMSHDASSTFKKGETGGRIPIKRLYENEKNWPATFLNIQTGNGMPEAKDVSGAILDRMLPIEFHHQHDRSLTKNKAVIDDYIYDENVKESFLKFLIEHANPGPWIMTKESKELLQQTQGEQDPVAHFLQDVVPRLTSKVWPSTDFYNLFYNECITDGTADAKNMLSQAKFESHLQELTEDTIISRNAEISKARAKLEAVIKNHKKMDKLELADLRDEAFSLKFKVKFGGKSQKLSFYTGNANYRTSDGLKQYNIYMTSHWDQRRIINLEGEYTRSDRELYDHYHNAADNTSISNLSVARGKLRLFDPDNRDMPTRNRRNFDGQSKYPVKTNLRMYGAVMFVYRSYSLEYLKDTGRQLMYDVRDEYNRLTQGLPQSEVNKTLPDGSRVYVLKAIDNVASFYPTSQDINAMPRVYQGSLNKSLCLGAIYYYWQWFLSLHTPDDTHNQLVLAGKVARLMASGDKMPNIGHSYFKGLDPHLQNVYGMGE